METTTVSIESHNTDESKLVLERMVCDKRPEHIDTNKDWNKKMPKTNHQPTTNKRKSPVDSSMMEDREENEEGQFSSSEQLKFKNLSEAISGYHAPSEQRRSQGRARSNSRDGTLERAPSQPDRNPFSEKPIISNKRRRYQRRNSFVIRHDKNRPPPPRGLLEGYDDDDEDSPLNRSAPDLFSRPRPEIHSDMEAWENLSWSNTKDTVWYRFSSMSFQDAAHHMDPRTTI